MSILGQKSEIRGWKWARIFLNSNELVVILVTSDPHPLNGLANKMADRPMVIPYSH
jgi:hypothetical protein